MRCKVSKLCYLAIFLAVVTLTGMLVACTPSGGTSSTGGNGTDNAILPTASIKLVPVSNDIPEEAPQGVICLDVGKGVAEELDIVINIANPDRYKILSLRYYIEHQVNGEAVRDEHNVTAENFGYDSDDTIVYIRAVQVGQTSGSVKIGFTEIRYQFKNEVRAIQGVNGTEFTVLIDPTFNLTMDISECGKDTDTITVQNNFASYIGVISDYEMNSYDTEEAYGKFGYVFAGWYTQKDGKGTRYSSTDEYIFYSDITLYAHYDRGFKYEEVTSDSGETYLNVTGLTDAGKATVFTIVIPAEIDGKTVRSIGYAAFSSVGSGKIFILPNTLYSIGDYAFNACKGVQVELASVREIGNFAFADCGKIVLGKDASIKLDRVGELPSSLVSIGKYAFRGTGWDTSVKNPYRDGYYKSDLTLIVPSTLSSIGEGAFAESLFKAVLFRTGIDLKNIGSSVFAGSKSLERVYTSFDYKSTGSGHIDFSVGDGLENIGEKMFYNCVALKSSTASETVRLAEGLKTIGDLAFASSGTGMTDLEYLRMPDSLERLGTESFANTGLTQVVFGTDSKLKVLGKWCFENSKFSAITLYSLTEYKEAPFWGNTALECINILTDNVPVYSDPNTVGLARNAKYYVKSDMLAKFRNDSSWNPKNGVWATYFEKPSDYIMCYDYIAEESNGVRYCYEPINDEGVYDQESTKIKITCVFGTDSEVNVPAYLVVGSKSYEVISVGKYFVHEKVKKINLPSTLIRIEPYAFYATSLYEVRWTVGGTVTALDGRTADSLCLEYIGEWAFYATSITKFVSNTKLQTIGTGAFGYCKNLAKIVLNKGTALSVGVSAFTTSGGSVDMGTSIVISKNVVEIGRSAFQDNVNLHAVYMELETAPKAPGGGYPMVSPFTGCKSINAIYLFNKDALSPTIEGSFACKTNKDGSVNTYYGIKQKDGITSAYVLSDKPWAEAIKGAC